MSVFFNPNLPLTLFIIITCHFRNTCQYC